MDSEMVRRLGFVIRQGRADNLTSEQIARAVIAEMREPTRAMVNAAWIDSDDSPNSPTGTLVRESSTYHAKRDGNLADDTAYEVWQIMIDAALQE